ncbi:hypothetical protein I204_07538 [Kwoniella mangroviensis CBS 8886]|nr:hypothetical protein I204_07538 [Kwoniella mangroviensis CBS 8886]
MRIPIISLSLLTLAYAYPAPLPTPTDTALATEGLTNSERLAKGLPLNKPKLLFDPTRIKTILPRQSSLTPPVQENNPSNVITSAPSTSSSSSSSSSSSGSVDPSVSLSISGSSSINSSESASASISASSTSSSTSTSASASTSESSSPTLKPSNPIEAGPVVTQAVRASYYDASAHTKRDGASNGDLGYLWGQYAGGGVWALTDDSNLAAKFVFQQDAFGSNNNILINDTFYDPQYDLPHLGASWENWSAYMNYGYSSPKNNLGGDDGNCIGLSRVSYTAPGFGRDQSSIWNSPTPGGEMIFEWTNQDGTVVQPNFYLMPEAGFPNIRVAVKGEDCGWPESQRIRLFYDDL